MKTNSQAVFVPAPPPATNSAAAGAGAAAADIRDIKAPVVIPAGWLWLVFLGGALVLALVSWWGWRVWRKRRAQPVAAEAPVPPHERARRRLQEALELIGQPRAFCIQVSDTLRLYLEEAFSLRAPERTTEEFLDELQSSPLLSYSQKQLLGDFLMRCDLVKFARLEPPADHLRDLHGSALRLIDETALLGQPLAPPSGPSRPPPLPAAPAEPPPAPPPGTAPDLPPLPASASARAEAAQMVNPKS